MRLAPPGRVNQEQLEARVAALEWVIETAIAEVFGPSKERGERRRSLLAALVRAAEINRATEAMQPDGPQTLGELSLAERLTLTIDETAAILGIGRSHVYELIRREELPSVQLGRRRLVPRAPREEWLRAGPPSQARDTMSA